jgi:flagellar hook-basal body complex protein FliE
VIDPIRPGPVPPVAPPQAPTPAPTTADGSFATLLRRQLEQVSALQSEAERGVQDLLTGKTQDITDVFAVARKAEIAFSLLLEIRNKLLEAYAEIKNLRV